MTTVRLTVPDPDELRSLDEWLRGTDALRGRVALEPRPPRPGEMGAVADSLLVTLAETAQAAALAQTVEIWLRQRGPEVRIMVRVGDRVAELSAAGGVDPAALLRLAVEAAGG